MKPSNVEKAPSLSSYSVDELGTMLNDSMHLMDELEKHSRELDKSNTLTKIWSWKFILQMRFTAPYIRLNIKNLEAEINRRKST